MRTILLTAALAVAAFAFGATAEAGPAPKKTNASHGHATVNKNHVSHATHKSHHGGPQHNFRDTRSSNYHVNHGVKFNGGYFFKGHHHSHWGHRKWDGYRRGYVYYEPVLRVYYFFDASRDGYYPCD